MIAALERILRLLETGGRGVASVAMIAVLMVVFADVVLRYLFSAPLSWAYDVISRYLLTAIFYFVVSDTLRTDQHIRVLFFRAFMPGRLKALVDACAYLASAFVVCLIAWLALTRCYGEFMRGDKFVGAYLWPTWITSAFVGVGMGVLGVRLVLMGILRGIDIPTGRPDPRLDDGSGETPA